MNRTYTLYKTSLFIRNSKKLKKKIPSIDTSIKATLKLLAADPFNPRLKTHTVNLRQHGKAQSSRIIKHKLSGDLRIIWEFDENNNLIILLINIGGHDDVY